MMHVVHWSPARLDASTSVPVVALVCEANDLETILPLKSAHARAAEHVARHQYQHVDEPSSDDRSRE